MPLWCSGELSKRISLLILFLLLVILLAACGPNAKETPVPTAEVTVTPAVTLKAEGIITTAMTPAVSAALALFPELHGTLYYNCNEKIMRYRFKNGEMKMLIGNPMLRLSEMGLVRENLYLSAVNMVPDEVNKSFGPAKIYRIDLNGNNLEQLTFASTYSFDSDLSILPGEENLIYTSDRGIDVVENRYVLNLMNMSDLSRKTLLGMDVIGMYTEVSPEGDKIAIWVDVSAADSDEEIMLLDMKTEQITPISSGGKIFLPELKWSPDGQQIAVSARDKITGGYEIVFLDVRSGEIVRVMPVDHFLYRLRWSPNGKKILYETTGEKNYELWMMEIGKDDPLLLKEKPFGGNFGYTATWSPDSSYFSYFVYDEDTSTTIQYFFTHSYREVASIVIPCHMVKQALWSADD